MKWVSSVQQARRLEELCEQEAGVGPLALMELAARGVVRRIEAQGWCRDGAPAVVVCGPGNNGGDGYAIARWLLASGVDVRVVEALPPRSPACIHQRDALARCGGGVLEAGVHGLEGCGLLIDALFGAGLSRPLEGELSDLVVRMGQAGKVRVAIDLPTGIAGDHGSVEGVVFRAHHTLMLGHYKFAAFLPPASEAMGRVWLEDLGFGALPQLREGGKGADLIAAEVPDWADLSGLTPARPANSHKGMTGHLLVVAGDDAMVGASILACRGAFAGGAGRVTLAAPSESWARLRGLPPEVMVEDGAKLQQEGFYESFDGVVAGPGLNARLGDAKMKESLLTLWETGSVPVLYDAGALALLSAPGVQGPAKSLHERLITPHPGEAARILNCTSQDIQRDRLAAASSLSRNHTTLLKGRHTLVGDPHHRLSINTSGAPALATAGSGDVLAGLCGALMARGLSARDAARVGAYVHGKAGESLPSEGAVAGDLCRPISSILGQRAS